MQPWFTLKIIRPLDEVMNYYVTSYALTSGVMILDGAQCEQKDSTLIYRGTGDGRRYDQYFHGEGKDWHRSRPSAMARVMKMIAAKRKSLEKSLAKLNKPVAWVEVL